MEWNNIPGLTKREKDWMDDLAHGYSGKGVVNREMVKWVCRLLVARAYAAYANHCMIEKKVGMTFHTWKRKNG